MTNPTFLWHVSMAIHEDRMRAVQQSRRDRSCAPSRHARRTLGLYRHLVCRLQIRTARVSL